MVEHLRAVQGGDPVALPGPQGWAMFAAAALLCVAAAVVPMRLAARKLGRLEV